MFPFILKIIEDKGCEARGDKVITMKMDGVFA